MTASNFSGEIVKAIDGLLIKTPLEWAYGLIGLLMNFKPDQRQLGRVTVPRLKGTSSNKWKEQIKQIKFSSAMLAYKG
jgi:hypothetical protein